MFWWNNNLVFLKYLYCYICSDNQFIIWIFSRWALIRHFIFLNCLKIIYFCFLFNIYIYLPIYFEKSRLSTHHYVKKFVVYFLLELVINYFVLIFLNDNYHLDGCVRLLNVNKENINDLKLHSKTIMQLIDLIDNGA